MTRGRRRPGSDPIPLSNSLERLRADLELPSTSFIDEVTLAWNAVAPEELRSRSRVRSVRSRRVTVEATPEVAGQLRYLESALVEEVARRCEPGQVSGLVVVVVPRLETENGDN